ncbi:MAG: hypothetical protein KDD11_12700, partial [Acidobacteria bacterium]|nr:hypothetical protein [Acidobacteriota bacterium]
GDLARYREDGELEFLGRGDFQVKVRGNRVELEEVENALRRHDEVAEAVVVAREASGGTRLVAYVVPVTGDAESGGLQTRLRAALKEALPEYMVPATFVVLGELPLTPNGKVDRAALPKVGYEAPAAAEYRAPRDEVEQQLAAIWSEVLGVPRVGVRDDFFELGGDSILSLQIVSRAQRAGLRLTPRQIFEHPTVAELARLAGSAETVTAEQGEVVGPVPLSPIQRWYLERDLEAPEHFTLPLLLEPVERLEEEPLRAALAVLLRHHDALRARFTRGAGGWEQELLPSSGLGDLLEIVDLAGLDAAAQKTELARRGAELQAGLDLAAGRVFRGLLADLGDNQRLLLVAHHLVVDTVSWRLLVEDLGAAYRALAAGQEPLLPAKTTSWRAWQERLAERAASDDLTAETRYWLDPARAEVAELPADIEGGGETGELGTEGSARTVRVSLGAETTRSLLEDASRAYRTGVQDLLLTALARAVADWSGERRLLVDLEGHGREEIAADVDLSRTAGWFATLYPVLLDLEYDDEPGAEIKAVKEQLRAVPSRGLGYGLLRYLRPETAEALARLRAIAERTPAYRNVYLSEDGSYAGLVIDLDAGAPPTNARGETFTRSAIGAIPEPGEMGSDDLLSAGQVGVLIPAARRVLERHAAPGTELFLSGEPVFNYEFSTRLPRDMGIFTGVSIAFIAGLLAFLFRRASGVLLPLGIT